MTTNKGGTLNPARFQKESIEQDLIDLQIPTQLLKFGRGGKPQFRIFSLTPDIEYLQWQSKKKTDGQARVALKDINDIKFGQVTDKFKRNNRADLQHLSFSLIYRDEQGNNDSLDLVCKDAKEYELWTKTLQALIEDKIDKALLERIRSTNYDAVGAMKVTTRDAFQGANDVYAFGWGEWGQNGIGVYDTQNQTSPKLLETFLGKGVTQVVSGWTHSLALTETGEVMGYGTRVPCGLSEDSFLPVKLSIPDKTVVTTIACGGFHSAALTEKGHVLTWGCNLNGQLGHGNYKDALEPKLVQGLLHSDMGIELFITQIVCGANFTAALGDDGRVYTFGGGDVGQLGHNDSKDQVKPRTVKDLFGMDVLKIAAGDYHMVACTESETYTWGWNGCGQLGLGSLEDQHRPQIVDILRGDQVEDISCGSAHTFALVHVKNFNQYIVYSWGLNSNGQLGQGKKKLEKKPFPVPGLGKLEVVEIKCGTSHTILRLSNGDIMACGSNRHGQLGHGNNNDYDAFAIVEFLKGKNARILSAGGENSAVLTARAWVEDSEAKECMACKSPFSFVVRKHHCRNCGGIFCNPCSSKKIAILKYGLAEPQRVCVNCFTKLGGR